MTEAIATDMLRPHIDRILRLKAEIKTERAEMRAKRGGYATKRAAEMADLYRQGETLEQIGSKFGVTRERVRQIISRTFGLNGADGGASVKSRKAAEARAEREARLIARREARWGCTTEQFKTIPRPAKTKFRYDKANYSGRYKQDSWDLNIWQWWSIWQASGHRLDDRRYCLRRHDPSKPHSATNTYIGVHPGGRSRAK